MRTSDGETVLASLILDPTTRQRCSPRYDELLVTATFSTDSLVTVVYRAVRQGELRVLQLELSSGRWRLATEQKVPIVRIQKTERTPLSYPRRTFHFVPGTGEAPSWVDEDRLRRS